jgi:ABC-2 type transport system ATP-binding protein
VSDRVIEVEGLHKSYGDVEAVRGVDLHVDRGEVFALLGPNGAGKTTTVEILEGFRTATAGRANVLGHDPGRHEKALTERIGIVLQSTGVDPYLSVRETVELYSGYYPNPRPAPEVIELVGLGSKSDTRVLKLSGGQQRRLDVAIALAGDPELLFPDEPTTGFDPSARHAAWDIIKSLTALGKTVFLTTHFMDEAQFLADRLAVLARGEIVAEGTPSTIAGRDQMMARIQFRVDGDGADLPSLGQVRDEHGIWTIRAEDPTRPLHELTGWAIEHGVTFPALEVTRPSLEDVYLEITGGEVVEVE